MFSLQYFVFLGKDEKLWNCNNTRMPIAASLQDCSEFIWHILEEFNCTREYINPKWERLGTATASSKEIHNASSMYCSGYRVYLVRYNYSKQVNRSYCWYFVTCHVEKYSRALKAQRFKQEEMSSGKLKYTGILIHYQNYYTYLLLLLLIASGGKKLYRYIAC